VADQGNLGRYSSGHRPFDRQTPEIALVEGADGLTALGRLQRQVGIGEIYVPVTGQLDRPNDQLPVVDFDSGSRYEGMMTCAMTVMEYR
jgi:hypothetical protein